MDLSKTFNQVRMIRHGTAAGRKEAEIKTEASQLLKRKQVCFSPGGGGGLDVLRALNNRDPNRMKNTETLTRSSNKNQPSPPAAHLPPARTTTKIGLHIR
jgi:hypothetical protein